MDSGVFPFRESSSAKITSHALAKESLIYTTNVIINHNITWQYLFKCLEN